jgi:hypothetical protein
MARDKALASYVKTGTENAETEIELKGKAGKRNIVIKRMWDNHSDKSEWRLNG